MTETQVGELLQRATSDLSPTTDLVAAGIGSGRQRRRRGLAAWAAGSLAATAVVAGAVALSPANGSDPNHTVVADPSGSTGTAPYAAQSSAPAVSPAPAANDGPFPVAPDAMASTLATLVSGTVTGTKNDQYHLDDPDGWQSGAVEVDGGSVMVSIQHSTGPRCDGDLARGNRDCQPLGGGYFTSTYSAEITSKGEGLTGVHEIGVTYYTPDGIKINATAGNSGFSDPAHPTTDHPVLDLAALTEIATNPVWQGK